MNYNSKYAGQYYQLQSGEVYVLRGDGKFAYAGVDSSGFTAVQLTGYYKQGADGTDMFQTVDGGWIRMADGWEYIAYAPIRQYTQKDAQYYVNKVIKNNAHIYENNLFCARFANKLNEDQKVELMGLQKRLEDRNNQLLNDGLCTGLQVSTPPGYRNLQPYLTAFMNGGGIGVAVSTIVVVAVVIASLSTAAYFAYKYIASESEKDVKYSDELTSVLMQKLSDEEYKQLLQETQGIVTKAKLTSRLGGGLSLVKWGLLAVGCFAIYKAWKNRKGE